jgi:molybdopterin-guanine dinucleotide biosynthesis protein A
MSAAKPDGFDPAATPVPAYVLAGGRSSRFGSDKARAVIHGVPLIVRVADSLARSGLPVTVVAARSDAYSDLGLTTIGDIVPGQGPLGGLWTALDHRGGDGWAFVCACDWVGVRPEWIRLLVAAQRNGAQAVLFASDREQPLFGLYHTSIRETAARRVETGTLKMLDFVREIDVLTVPAPVGWRKAINLNRPFGADGGRRPRR